MRRYPQCGMTQRMAFYGIVVAVLLAGVAGRELTLNGQVTQPSPVVSAL